MSFTLPENLSDWIHQFDVYSLDAQAFWVFRNCGSYQEQSICLQFKRSQSPQNWSIWIEGLHAESLRTMSHKHVQQALQAFFVNEKAVENELKTNLLMQAGGADEFVRHIGEIIGRNALAEAINNTQSFMHALSESVNAQLGEKNPETKNTQKDKQVSAQARKLRLV